MNAKILMALAGAAVASTALAQGPAAGIRLTDGNHVYQTGTSTATAFPTTNVIPTAATNGLTIVAANFLVPRNTVTTSVTGGDHMTNNWWFFRLAGQTREMGFTAPTARVQGTNTASYEFTLATGVTALLQYTLTSQGALQANLLQSVTITNNSGAALSMNLFHTIDLDLVGTGGAFPGDAYSTPGGYTLGTAANRTLNVVDGFASAQAIGFNSIAYSAAGFTAHNGLMTDGDIDNYADGALPAAADNAYGFQWLIELANGASMTVHSALAISTEQGVAAVAIPTPGALALLGLGGMAATRRRRA